MDAIAAKIQDLSLQAATVAKIPPFETLDPEFWFQQCESQFIISKIIDDQTKYHYIVAHLPLKISRLVRDVIKHKYTANLYKELKQAVIDRLSTHAAARVNALLEDTRMQPGELPSHFYRRMMELAATDVSFNVVFSRFISLLPSNISDSIQSEANTVLANFKEAQKIDDKRVAAILDTADAIASRSGKQVAAAHKKATRPRQQVASTRQPSSPRYQNNQQRSNSRPQQQQQRRSTSQRPPSRPPQQRRPFSWFCFNHARFGDNTRKCAEPGKCTYRQTVASVDADDKFSDEVEVFYNSAVFKCTTAPRSQRLFVEDDVHHVKFLIDTGSDISLLPRSRLSLFTLDACAATNIELRAANGSAINVHGSTVLKISLDRVHFAFPFIVADVHQCIIGADFLAAFSLIVDVKRRMMFNDNAAVSCIRNTEPYSPPPTVVVNPFSALFEEQFKPQDISTPSTRHYIITSSPRPLAATPRRLYGDKLESAKAYFQEMISQGICRPSKSPWSSPLHLVKKQNGAWRPCGDYRRLNLITKPDAYPLPYLQDFVVCLKDKQVFSTLDIRSAFWTIPMADQDIEKTAITTPFGLFEFVKMPFGLCNAAQTFQRHMDCIFREMPDIFVYLDDILVASVDRESHLSTLKKILQILANHGMNVNHEKSVLAKPVVIFLGFEVSREGIKPTQIKSQEILDFPRPLSIKQVRRFTGMLNFYRKCIPKLSHILAPLFSMSEEDFTWTEERVKAFEAAKTALSNAVTIAYPDFNLPFHLYTDASSVAIGGALQQIQNGKVIPLGFFSRKLHGAELNYCTFDAELLAIRSAVEHFVPIIEGRKLIIFTDHKPLVAAFTKAENRSPRQARHFAFISEFTSQIQHIPGEKNIVADALSRPHTDAISSESLASEQSLDPQISAFLASRSHQTQMQTLPSGSCLLLVNNNAQFKPFVPLQLRKQIFDHFHNLCHSPAAPTRIAIEREYFWPAMRNDVARWCAECIPCQQAKVTRHIKIPPVQIPVPNVRFSHVNIDLVGPLPPSPEGFRHLLTMMDRFTRWPEAIPLKNIYAADVASAFLLHWVARFGVPELVTTDQGTQFESDLFHQFNTLLGIDRIRTAPFNPRANGLIERFHRTLKASLYARKQDWLTALPLVLLGLRTTFRDTLKASPAELVFGTTLQLPGSFLDESLPAAETITPHTFVQDLKRTMSELQPIQTTPSTDDSLFIPKSLRDATHVFLRKHLRTGLAPPYVGPFLIVKRHDRTITIRTNDGDKEVSLEHVKPAVVGDRLEFDIPRGRGRPRKVGKV